MGPMDQVDGKQSDTGAAEGGLAGQVARSRVPGKQVDHVPDTREQQAERGGISASRRKRGLPGRARALRDRPVAVLVQVNPLCGLAAGSRELRAKQRKRDAIGREPIAG
eukprot:11222413-Lingulodinium_polyedra.AAC.1